MIFRHNGSVRGVIKLLGVFVESGRVNRLSWCLLKIDQKGIMRWLGWIKLQRVLFR